VWVPAVSDKPASPFLDFDMLTTTRVSAISVPRPGMVNSVAYKRASKAELWSGDDISTLSLIGEIDLPADGAPVPLPQSREARYFRLYITASEKSFSPLGVNKMQFFGCSIPDAPLPGVCFANTTVDSTDPLVARHFLADPESGLVYFCDSTAVEEFGQGKRKCYSSMGPTGDGQDKWNGK